MLKAISKICVIALLLVGCGKTQQDDIPAFIPHFEFSVSQEDIDKYPLINQYIKVSLSEWAEALPASIGIGIDNGQFPLKVINLNHFPIPGIIAIYGKCTPDEILLDPSLEQVPEIAHSVILHEIGHHFGLPHIVGTDSDRINDGALIVGNDEEARKYVMYPSPNSILLSPLELEIVRRSLGMR